MATRTHPEQMEYTNKVFNVINELASCLLIYASKLVNDSAT